MKELELYDIYGTWHVPFWQTQSFLICVGAIGVLLLLGLLWFLYKKYKKTYSIPLPQRLLAQLAAVGTRPISAKQDAQNAYSTITDSLKAYFEHYYGKPFKALSDTQMIQTVQATPGFPAEFNEALKKMIEDSAQVKFARETALQEHVINHAQLSINIINHLEKARKSA